jgi:hypothetical protein
MAQVTLDRTDMTVPLYVGILAFNDPNTK